MLGLALAWGSHSAALAWFEAPGTNPVLLKHFSASEKCFNSGFGASSEPGLELGPKPFLKHFSGSEKCFKKGFGTSSGPGPENSQETFIETLFGV